MPAYGAPQPGSAQGDGSTQREGSAALEAERDALQEELAGLQLQHGQAILRWHALFDALPAAAFVIDGFGRVQRANAEGQAWMNLAPQPEASDLCTLLGLGSSAPLMNAFSSAAAEHPAVLDLQPGGPSPTLRQRVELRVLALDGHRGINARMLVILVPRERPRADHDNPQLLRALLDSTSDLVYAVGPQGHIMYANAAAARLLGQPVQALLGRHRDDLFPVAEELLQHLHDEQVPQEGGSLVVHELFGSADGSERHLRSSRFPLYDADGRVTGIGGVSRDITAEVERDRQRDLSELVFSQSSDAIAVLDADGTILRVNPSFESLTATNAATVLGRPLWLVQPLLALDPPGEPFWKTVRQRQGWSGEIASRTLEGRPYTVRCTVTPLRDAAGRVGSYAVVQSNLTHLRLAQARVETLAAQDELTRLPNRRVMLDRLEQLILYARRRKARFALLFLDLDHFKEVNDTLGHHVGDQLLQLVADRLRNELRSQDTVARNGGDEFVVLLPDTTSEAAQAVGQKLANAVTEPVAISGLDDYRPSMSVGVVAYPDDGVLGDMLLRNADSAMYAAKAAGRNQVMAYTQAMSEAAASFLDIQTSLPLAIIRGEMRLVYQPKFRLADRAVVGAEALVRWERAGQRLLAPREFLPLAERSGVLTLLDDWVLDEAVATAARWYALGLLPPGWRLSVNQAAPDIKRPDWLQRLIGRLGASGLPGEHLEIELTEGLLAQPTPEVLANLSQLRVAGIQLSVDDFGTGYSSMAYLKSLPIAVMKIDGGFVRDMVIDANDRNLVEAMISLGHKLGHETVAECIETEAQAQVLAAMGCDVGQGFLLSEPLPSADFECRFLGAGGAGRTSVEASLLPG